MRAPASIADHAGGARGWHRRTGIAARLGARHARLPAMPRSVANPIEPSDDRDDADPPDSPVVIRSRIDLAPGVERAIRTSLDRRLGNATGLILRGTVQL